MHEVGRGEAVVRPAPCSWINAAVTTVTLSKDQWLNTLLIMYTLTCSDHNTNNNVGLSNNNSIIYIIIDFFTSSFKIM